MTDRYKGLTVVLSEDLREDDAEALIKAIQMLKGVADVKPVVTNADDYINRMQVQYAMRRKFWALFDDLFKDD